MRKNTLLFGVLSLFGASQAMADDWVIELMKNNASHLELVKDASFDVGYGCIGNTSTETVIGLGEVDFGTDGTNYKATGVEFAHGWGELRRGEDCSPQCRSHGRRGRPVQRNDRDPHLRLPSV